MDKNGLAELFLRVVLEIVWSAQLDINKSYEFPIGVGLKEMRSVQWRTTWRQRLFVGHYYVTNWLNTDGFGHRMTIRLKCQSMLFSSNFCDVTQITISWSHNFVFSYLWHLWISISVFSARTNCIHSSRCLSNDLDSSVGSKSDRLWDHHRVIS